MADKPVHYVWVVEKRLHGAMGCSVYRYAFVKKNSISITVLDHGGKKVIYNQAHVTFLYDPLLVKPAIVKHLRDQHTRLKMDLAKIEKMIDDPDMMVNVVDHKPYPVIENLELD